MPPRCDVCHLNLAGVGGPARLAQPPGHPLLRRWPTTAAPGAAHVAWRLQACFGDGHCSEVRALGRYTEAGRAEFGMNTWEPWIGRVTTTSAWLDPEQANRMSATLDRDPRFTAGDTLPPAWHWLYFHDIVRASDLGVDGHPRLGVTMPPVPLARRMWAGGTLVFEEPLRLGATVERTSTIRSITPKQGRTGQLFFVTVEHDLHTAGTRNVLEHQTIVYREEMSATADIAAAQAAPSDAAFSARWSLDRTALFRYSALTFNGHRIHYDADYCRDVEGYPGLVIHGPLIATLLLDLAVRERRPVDRFTYRARSPLFLPHAFTVNGRPDGAATALWAASDAGNLAMQAHAAA